MSSPRGFAKADTGYDLAVNWTVHRNITLRAGNGNLTDISTLEEGNGYDGGSRAYFVGMTGRF